MASRQILTSQLARSKVRRVQKYILHKKLIIRTMIYKPGLCWGGGVVGQMIPYITIFLGPWCRSSGQLARLLLGRSEFESCLSIIFFVKFVFEKNENKQFLNIFLKTGSST